MKYLIVCLVVLILTACGSSPVEQPISAPVPSHTVVAVNVIEHNEPNDECFIWYEDVEVTTNSGKYSFRTCEPIKLGDTVEPVKSGDGIVDIYVNGERMDWYREDER